MGQIRVRSYLLKPWDPPVLDFPDWTHNIFFFDKEGKEIKIQENKTDRIFLPEFEVSFIGPTKDLAFQGLHDKVIGKLKDLKAFNDGYNRWSQSVIIVPCRAEFCMEQADKEYCAVTHLACLLTYDYDPTEKEKYFSWLPEYI